MKVLYTDQAIESLQESLHFLRQKSNEKQIQRILNSVFSRCEKLKMNPNIGQTEEYLEHLGLNHRRVIAGHFKIIYRIDKKVIYITDIFDSRQLPSRMKT